MNSPNIYLNSINRIYMVMIRDISSLRYVPYTFQVDAYQILFPLVTHNHIMRTTGTRDFICLKCLRPCLGIAVTLP